MIEPEPLQQVDRTHVLHHGRKFTYFSGCDYFRLASHPKVLRAAQDAVSRFGLNVAASRLTTGNHRLHETLEKELAGFFGAEAALLVSGGYSTDRAVAQSLAGEFSHALVDERAHPALMEAAQALDCPVLKFKHRDPEDLSRGVARCGQGARPIVLTDGMFSPEGSVAPLKAYLKELPRDGWILVDDAHAAGILGKSGQGSLEFAGVRRDRVIQCVTLSKAFGAYGGAVIGSRKLRQTILARCRMFIGSTPLPLPLAAAALASVKLLRRDRRMRQRLAENTNFVKATLRKAGLPIADTPGPMISIVTKSSRETTSLRRRLLAAGIFPPFVVYPGAPAEGCFRFAISSEHSRGQLRDLIQAISPVAD